VQVFDTERFSGRSEFERQTAWLAHACRSTPPRPGVDAVRVPGEHALQRKRRAMVEGVTLFASIVPALTPWAEKFGIPMPTARSGA
jgi:L-lactate dehydrogenase